MNYQMLHESFSFDLYSPERKETVGLLAIFKSLGYTRHDDIISLDRTDKVPPWQHSSIVEVDILCDGTEIYGFNKQKWDTLRPTYLFSALPFYFTTRFIDSVFCLANLLDLTATYKGLTIAKEDVSSLLEKMRKDVLTETGEEPGSENLAIYIQGTYPRTSMQ